MPSGRGNAAAIFNSPLPMFSPAANHPERQQTRRATRRVNEHVGHMRCARGHKNLMEFIARGVERDEQQREVGFAPVPGTADIFHGFPQRAPEQQGQYGIFGQVRAFAGKENEPINRVRRKVREHPVQQGREDARGMFVRMRIAGCCKNQRHPDQHRQPVFAECAQLRHAG